MSRPVRVALAGLGTVGRRVARALVEDRPFLEARLGAGLELVAAADREAGREARALGLPASVRRLRDPRELASVEADVFVELLGGLDAPRELALAVLGGGRRLVTANKRLLAHAGPELEGAAARGGGRLAFEASVAAAVPVLRAVSESLRGDRVESVMGILNGTTNYILTRLEEGGGAAAALRRAQRAGYAEKDPSFDLSGADAAQKLCVLARAAAGAWLAPESVPFEGIEALQAEDAAFARERLGRTPRLLARLELDWADPLSPAARAWVAPCLIPLSHPLAGAREAENGVLARAALAGELLFRGGGAGAEPTASAVLGDILDCARGALSGRPAGPAVPPGGLLRLQAGEEAPAARLLRLRLRGGPAAARRAAAALREEGLAVENARPGPARGGARARFFLLRPAPRARVLAGLSRALALPGTLPERACLRLLP